MTSFGKVVLENLSRLTNTSEPYAIEAQTLPNLSSEIHILLITLSIIGIITHLITALREARCEEGVRVLEGLDLHVLDDGGADLVLQVVPGQPPAQPLHQVVEEHLQR